MAQNKGQSSRLYSAHLHDYKQPSKLNSFNPMFASKISGLKCKQLKLKNK